MKEGKVLLKKGSLMGEVIGNAKRDYAYGRGGKA